MDEENKSVIEEIIKLAEDLEATYETKDKEVVVNGVKGHICSYHSFADAIRIRFSGRLK